ncbi:MAG: zinc ribbon domain-containing protein, partial [Mycobacterium sp.]|nr:zinc ribbon domain-containing protein [Mycobacterium sp.]
MVSPSSPTPGHARRPVAVLGTLLPHMHPGRHHVYRDVVALALLAALIAAGVGSLSVALVLTAVALPSAVLVYIHDHRLWHDEPITLIAVAFGLSLLLGIGVGLLETYFVGPVLVSGATSYHLPPVEQIVELGLLVPAVAFVAVVISPLVVSGRSAFSHPYDVVVAAALSGAALSLGLSVVVQHGAFAHVQLTGGDPAHVAFIALTLGFLQPIVLATAATVAALGVRGLGISPVVGVIEGLALVVAYELATTLLVPYGTRGIVLTALTAFVLAGAGLIAVRNGLHAAIAADTSAPGDAAGHPHVEHRLHGAVVAAIVALVVLIAAVVAVAVDWSGSATRPTLPGRGHGGMLSHAAGPVMSPSPHS